MKKIYIYSILLLITHTVFSQQATSLRGIYIDHFSDIAGNSAKEDSLLQYAQDSSFNYLALYDLQSLNLSNTNTANTLAAFIKRARENYGVQYVGAVVENYNSIKDKVVPYNNNRSDDHEKFNVFNLEFEFWTQSSVTTGGYYCNQYLIPNGCSCDSSGGFKFFIQQMHKIDSIAAVQQVVSETYLGWFNQGQAQQIQQNVDRILLHAYRTNTSSLFSYSKTRLQYLASNNSMVDVAPIFSAEPNFMGPWLDSHTQLDAYAQYENDMSGDNSSWLQYINLLGYHWFTLRYMPRPAPGTSGTFSPVINASGSLNICPGGSVTLTATHGDTYNWSNGATTQSITVNASSALTCTVTYNGSTKTTPSVSVSVKNLPTVSISEGTPSPGIVPLTANATAGSGSISTYQWSVNSSPLNGATSSTHNASVSGTYAVTVTNSFGCGTTSNGQNITVTGAACNPTVPTGLSSSAVTELSQTVSWNGIQSGDSIIVRYHPDSTSTYNYVRMLNTGQTSCVLSGLAPNTLYSWRVKTTCGTVSGAYSSKDYFTTGSSTNNIPHIRDVTAEGEDESGIFNVFPNPVQSQLNIAFASEVQESAQIIVTDLDGRLVYTTPVEIISGDNKYILNTSMIMNGLYFVSILRNGNTINRKVIINH